MADLPDGFFNLKHRVVGATVLILVAVILLPRVLTGTDVESGRSSVDVRTVPQILPQVLSAGNPSNSDLVEVSTKTRIEIIEQPAVTRTDDERGSAQSRDLQSADGIKDRSVEIPLSSGSSVFSSIVTGFIVQVGIFQRPENARNLILNLKEDGIDAKVETIEIEGRQATRIWLGPFSTRSEATREGNKAMMRSHSKPIVKEWP
jgi:cell division septation protein DedD